MNNPLARKIYQFECADIRISEHEIAFSADPMPLDQNCDMVELYRSNYLRLFYDDGSCLAAYAPAFEYIYLDSSNNRLDIYVSNDYLEEGEYSVENNFELISIYFKNGELLSRLQNIFTPDTLIPLENWID